MNISFAKMSVFIRKWAFRFKNGHFVGNFWHKNDQFWRWFGAKYFRLKRCVFRPWHLLGSKYLFVVNCMWIAFHFVLSRLFLVFFVFWKKSGGAEFQKEFTNNNLSRSKVRAVPYPLLSTRNYYLFETIKINNRL